MHDPRLKLTPRPYAVLRVHAAPTRRREGNGSDRLRQRSAVILALVHHAPEEYRVAQEIAPPHPARLDRQAEDPLEPVVGHPVRRPLHAPRDVVEQRADRPHDVGIEAVEVVVDPQLLQWRSHADQQDVRLVLGDVLDDALGVRRADLEVAVVRAAHVEAGVPALQARGGLLRGAGVRAEQVERAPLGLAQRGDSPDPVGAGHAVRNREPDRLGREPHPVAVAVDEVGSLERAAQGVVGERLVEDVRVDVGHAPVLTALGEAEDAPQQLGRRRGLDVEPEQPAALSQLGRHGVGSKPNGAREKPRSCRRAWIRSRLARAAGSIRSASR